MAAALVVMSLSLLALSVALFYALWELRRQRRLVLAIREATLRLLTEQERYGRNELLKPFFRRAYINIEKES